MASDGPPDAYGKPMCGSCHGPKDRSTIYCWGCWRTIQNGVVVSAAFEGQSPDVGEWGCRPKINRFHDWGPRPSKPEHILPGQAWLFVNHEGQRYAYEVSQEPSAYNPLGWAKLKPIWSDVPLEKNDVLETTRAFMLSESDSKAPGTWTFLRHAYDAATFDPAKFPWEDDYVHVKGPMVVEGDVEAAFAVPSREPEPNPYDVDPDLARHRAALFLGILGGRSGRAVDPYDAASYYD